MKAVRAEREKEGPQATECSGVKTVDEERCLWGLGKGDRQVTALVSAEKGEDVAGKRMQVLRWSQPWGREVLEKGVSVT